MKDVNPTRPFLRVWIVGWCSNRSELWIEDRSDAFAWQFRVSQSEDKEEAEEYFNQAWPVYLVRARRDYNNRRAHPIPKVCVCVRACGHSVKSTAMRSVHVFVSPSVIRATSHPMQPRHDTTERTTQPAPRPKGTGKDESYLHGSMKTLEERVVQAYDKAGSRLSYRFPMDHVVPDIDRCLRDPHYMPIFQPVPAWHFPGWPR